MSTLPPDEDGFAALGVPAPLLDAIRGRGLTAPTQVQSRVADPAHADRDLLVSSQTGSGKTLAFGLLIAKELLPVESGGAGPKALVLAPTRELAVQVQRELEWLFAKARLRVLSVTGGTNAREEMKQLKRGTDILVATPGRLVDHMRRKTVALVSAKVVVLDEADEMLRFGFREDLETILQGAPEARRTHLFSATLPPPILKLAQTYQQDPARVSAGIASGVVAAHQDIEYIAHVFGSGQREAAVVNVLRRHDAPAAIVFTATRAGAARLGGELASRGFAAVTLSGEMTQPERTRALASLRDGRAKVMVATDVAARGLDLPDVGLVVHADLPNDAQGITHRSGRTGRAGKKGVSVLLASRNERNAAERMLRGAGVRVRWSPLPTAEEIAAADAARLAAELAQEATAISLDDRAGAVVDGLIDRIPVRDLVAALLARVTGTLPKPAEVRAVAFEESRGRDRDHERERPPRERAGFERPLHPKRPRSGGPAVQFRVNIGERQRAEARWLVPLICRRGGVEGRDIGKITILKRSAVFEILGEAAARFERQATRVDPQDPKVLFARVTGDEADADDVAGDEGPAAPPRSRAPARPASERFGRPRPEDSGRPPRAEARPSRDVARPPRDAGPRSRVDSPPERSEARPAPREGFARPPREAPAREAASPTREGASRPPREETGRPARTERRSGTGTPRAGEPERRRRPAREGAASTRNEGDDLRDWKGPRGKPRASVPAGYDD